MVSHQKIWLGIQDSSGCLTREEGPTPFCNEDKSVWAALDGEIYNAQELRELLRDLGHRFSSEDNTAILPHLYEEYEDACPRQLRGSFVFCIWDKKKRKILLCREKIGVKPLYYTVHEKTIHFSTRIDPLLTGKRRDINYQALDNFMSFFHTQTPLTMFSEVYALPPGYTLSYRDNVTTLKKYWEGNFTATTLKTGEFQGQILNSLRARIEERVSTHHGPYGVFLSGGVDSSVLVALLKEISDFPIKTFSIGFGKNDAPFDELGYARFVSSYFGTDHYEYIMSSQDVIEFLPEVILHIEEPFGNSSALATFLASKLAKEHVGMVFSGLGSDEIFAGHQKHIIARHLRSYLVLPPFLRKKIIPKLCQQLAQWVGISKIDSLIKNLSANDSASPEKVYQNFYTFFSEEEKESLYAESMKDLLADATKNTSSFPYMEDLKEGSFPNNVMDIDTRIWLIDDLLKLTAKIAQASSLHIQLPFCDEQYVELAGRIPFELKVRGFTGKYIFKRALEGVLPKKILKRRRQGFKVPVGHWFQKDLKRLIEEYLSPHITQKRGYFKSSYISQILKDHFAGKEDLGDYLWALLTLELWHQIYLDDNSGTKPLGSLKF